jgi:hypothetical protein
MQLIGSHINPVFLGALIMGVVLAMDAVAQQPDPAKLAPFLQMQRDAANNQVAACAVLSNELIERVKTLEAELAKLKPAEPAK